MTKELLKRIWFWLTEPPTSLQDTADRRHTRLLASLLAIMIPLALVIAAVPPLLDPSVAVLQDFDVRLIIISLFFWSIVYSLNRNGHYKLAVQLAVGVGTICVFALATLDDDLKDLNYLIMPVLLSSLLFPAPKTLAFIGLNVAGILLVPAFKPDVSLEQILVGPLSFMLIGATLILLSARHRDQLERDRQAELAESAAQLRRYSERLKILREIDLAILAAQSPKAISQAALKQLCQLVPCPGGSVITYAAETQEVTILVAELEGDKPFLYPGQRFSLASLGVSEATKRVLQKGEPLLIADLDGALSTPLIQMLQARKWKSVLAAPIMFQEKLIGILALGAKTHHVFGPEQVEIVREVNHSLAIAIQQAQLRQELELRAQQLEASLQEKEVLFKEIHHRVKNNLQIISSLLNLQSGYTHDQQTLEMFLDSQNRIRSMGLIHEQLYQSQGLARIDFAEYVSSLAGYLFDSYGISTSHIALQIDAPDVSLSIDTAIPCGLIINELISNSLKHAFASNEQGTIQIGLHPEPDNQLALTFSDDGRGISQDLDISSFQTLGLQLVHILVEQLEGTIEMDRRGGTTFHIQFREAT